MLTYVMPSMVLVMWVVEISSPQKLKEQEGAQIT